MAKKKGSGSSFQNFLTAHFEKFLFVGLLAFAAMMAAKGSGLEKFKLLPRDIEDSANRAKQTIQENKVGLDDVDDTLKVYDYKAYSDLIKTALSPDQYRTPIRWEDSLFPEMIKRPSIENPLPVRGLRAVSCIGAIQYVPNTVLKSGAFTIGGAAGGTGAVGSSGTAGKIQGRNWIVVTGLVPVGEQLRIFNEKFSRAQFTDVDRDFPVYVSFEIERGVVGEDGQVQNWEPLNLEEIYEDEVDQWNGYGVDPVSEDHIAPPFGALPELAMPCPPMLNKAFRDEVAYLPEIPLMDTEQIDEQATLLKEQKKQEDEVKEQQKRDFSLSRAQSQYEFGGGAAAGARQNRRAGGMMGGMVSDLSDPDNPGMSVTSGSGMTGRPLGRRGIGFNGPQQVRKLKKAEESFYLFRFFDFNAEPGVTYQYRVKLLLFNPNWKLDTNLVEDPTTVDQMTVQSAFSEPSNSVALGTESRVLVESIVPASAPWLDPRVTVSSLFFSTEDAQESLAEGKKLARGQMANWPREKHNPVDLNGVGITRMDSVLGSTSKKDNKKGKGVDNHHSDLCLIDAFGGQEVQAGAYKVQTPSEAFFLDPNGLIKIHEFRTDNRELQRYKPSASETTGGVRMQTPGSLLGD